MRLDDDALSDPRTRERWIDGLGLVDRALALLHVPSLGQVEQRRELHTLAQGGQQLRTEQTGKHTKTQKETKKQQPAA